MSRRVAWVALATVLMSVLLALVTTSGGVQMWGEPQWDLSPREPSGTEIGGAEASESEFAVVDDSDDQAIEIPGWVDAVVRVVMVALVMVGVIAVLVAGWRNRPRVRWRRRFAGSDDFEVLPDVATAIVDEAATQRAALLGGEARNAIIRCWIQLEAEVAAAGLIRPPADTSAEFTERVLGRYTVDPEAISELAALYREARFSEHDLDESVRHAALDALDRFHLGLRAFAMNEAATDTATDTDTDTDAGTGSGIDVAAEAAT